MCNCYPTSKWQSGFTLIELLIVFSTMAVLAVTGIAAFRSFNNTQILTNAVLDVKSMFDQAKYKSLNQVVGSACTPGQQFNGYKVLICCKSGGSGCPTCSLGNDYELDAVCDSTNIPVSGNNLQKGVSIDTNISNTTSRTYYFNAVSGAVTGAGKITLNGFNMSRTITVSTTGVTQ